MVGGAAVDLSDVMSFDLGTGIDVAEGSSVSGNTVVNAGTITVNSITGPSGEVAVAGGVLLAGLAQTADDNEVDNSGHLTVNASTSCDDGYAIAGGIVIGAASGLSLGMLMGSDDSYDGTSFSYNTISNSGSLSVAATTATGVDGTAVLAGGIVGCWASTRPWTGTRSPTAARWG